MALALRWETLLSLELPLLCSKVSQVLFQLIIQIRISQLEIGSPSSLQ